MMQAFKRKACDNEKLLYWFAWPKKYILLYMYFLIIYTTLPHFSLTIAIQWEFT